jgi:anti-sigma regulatory factor (Ser/Thr protein kinase)/anti-anti-sigma regulatory factor
LVAAISGDLDLSQIAQLRLSLLKCLAEQPEAVLVDLSRMTMSDPLALSVFGAVRRQAARWPGIPLLLCAPEQLTAAHLHSARHRTLPVFATVEAAAAHVGRDRHTLPVISDDLLPVAGAARQARNLATEACVRWDLPELLAPASLLTSEFAGNVVDHAHTMMTVRLTLRPRYLQIAVRDGSPTGPEPQDAPDGASRRGRGLLLVEAVAHAWGWLPTVDGKVVWASLQVV